MSTLWTLIKRQNEYIQETIISYATEKLLLLLCLPFIRINCDLKDECGRSLNIEKGRKNDYK